MLLQFLIFDNSKIENLFYNLGMYLRKKRMILGLDQKYRPPGIGVYRYHFDIDDSAY